MFRKAIIFVVISLTLFSFTHNITQPYHSFRNRPRAKRSASTRRKTSTTGMRKRTDSSPGVAEEQRSNSESSSRKTSVARKPSGPGLADVLGKMSFARQMVVDDEEHRVGMQIHRPSVTIVEVSK